MWNGAGELTYNKPMNSKISGVFLSIMVTATFVAGAVVYAQVGGVRTAFGLPAVLLVLFGLWALLPAIDPVARGFPGFRYAYDFFWILLSAVLAYCYAVELGKAIGWRIDALGAVMPAAGALVFVTGALLPKIGRNWFFGIRTPWTLSSNDDWIRTHRFGRPLFMAAGAVILAGAFMPGAWSVALAIISVVTAAVITVLYSYFTYKP